MKMMSIVSIGELCNNIDICNIEGKQSDLCRGNFILSHVDCFCLQGKKEDEAETFCYSNTLVTASASSIILGNLKHLFMIL